VKKGDRVKTPDGLTGVVVSFPTRVGWDPRVRVVYDPGQENIPDPNYTDFPRFLVTPLQEEVGPDDA
jgi:hypothetical protein